MNIKIVLIYISILSIILLHLWLNYGIINVLVDSRKTHMESISESKN